MNWTSHVHRCTDCGRRWECGDPDCDTGTVGGDLCGSCESQRQYDYFHAQDAARAARQQQDEREQPRLEF